MALPGGLATVEVTGLNLLSLDGTPLSGTVIFSVDGPVAAPAVSALLEGSAAAEVQDGVMEPLVIPATDCVSPGFSYTVTQRLTTPDGPGGNPVPSAGVAIPSSLGPSVDLSSLVPSAPVPPPSAFGTANTWAQTQAFEGSPPLLVPEGAADGYVWTSDADGGGSWQPAGGGVPGSGTVTSVSVASANGFAGTVANPGTVPQLTLKTTVTGLLKGSSAAGAVAAAAAGTDYLAPGGSGAALTGITAAQAGADAAGAAASAQAASLQKSASLGDVASPATARANLGLGSAAVQSSAAFDAAGAASAVEALALLIASNLSDLQSAATARSNLGLGTAATQASGAFDAAGAAASAQSAAEAFASGLQPSSGSPLAVTDGGTGLSAASLAVLLASLLAAGGGAMGAGLAPKVVSLSQSGGSVAVDASAGNALNLTLTASGWTIANPSGPADAEVIRFRITQGAGGSFTVAWGSAYDFGSGSAPTLSTAAGKVDIIAFEYVSSNSKWCCLNNGGLDY